MAEIRLRRPAVQHDALLSVLHLDEELVAVLRRGLNVDLDTLDRRLVGVQLKLPHLVEELELHAPVLQGLVVGREDRIPHPRPHLEEDRVLVGEEKPDRPLQEDAGRDRVVPVLRVEAVAVDPVRDHSPKRRAAEVERLEGQAQDRV